MYPDSGYKQAHVQLVCTRPFSHIHREPGPGSTVASLSLSRSELIIWKLCYVQCVPTCLAAIIFIWTESITKFHVTIVIKVRGSTSWVRGLVMVMVMVMSCHGSQLPWSTVAQIDWSTRFYAFDKQNTTEICQCPHNFRWCWCWCWCWCLLFEAFLADCPSIVGGFSLLLSLTKMLSTYTMWTSYHVTVRSGAAPPQRGVGSV